MDKEEIVNVLSQLYRLREEGKNVEATIAKYEALLCSKCDEELDSKTADEED